MMRIHLAGDSYELISLTERGNILDHPLSISSAFCQKGGEKVYTGFRITLKNLNSFVLDALMFTRAWN